MDDQNLVRAFELAGKRMQEKRDRMCACIHAQRSPDWQRFVQPQQCVKLLSSSRSKHCTPSLSVAAAAPARPLPQRTVCTVRRDSACAHARAIDRERERERERERKKSKRERPFCVVDGCTLAMQGAAVEVVRALQAGLDRRL